MPSIVHGNTTDERFPRETESSNAVAWQTVYFILVALAACAAVQPSGGVFGVSKKYNVFLRISPIVCIVDAASIVLIPIFGRIWWGTSFKFVLDHLLYIRFVEKDEVQQEAASARATKNATLFRLLWFLFGGLFPSIKLVALSGVPASKTWGMMYAVSFVVGEIMIGLEQWRATRARNSRLIRMDFFDNKRKLLRAFLRHSARCAITSQLIILFVASVQVLNNIGWQISKGGYKMSRYESRSLFTIVPIGLYLCLVFISDFKAFYDVHAIRFSNPIRVVYASLLGCSTICIYVGGMWLYFQYFHLTSSNPWLVIIVSFLSFVVSTLPSIVRSYRSTHYDRSSGRTEWEILILLLHLVVPLSWYALAYQSEGTSTPHWITVLG